MTKVNTIFEEAGARLDGSALSYMQVAKHFRKHGEIGEEIKALEAGIEKYPWDSHLWGMLAKAHQGMKTTWHDRRALHALEQIHFIKPKDLNAMLNYTAALGASAKFSEDKAAIPAKIENVFLNFLRVNGEVQRAVLALGKHYAENGDAPRASACYIACGSKKLNMRLTHEFNGELVPTKWGKMESRIAKAQDSRPEGWKPALSQP